MNHKVRVLFITAPIGAGHVRAAQAVSKALQDFQPGVETAIANVFDFFPAVIGKSILKIYLAILDLIPGAYGAMYGWGNKSPLAVTGRELISKYLARQMRHYIFQYQPSAVVCTHATPAGLIAHLAKTTDFDIPTFAVITDFVVHRLWVYPEIGHYFVANETMRNYLIEHGLDSARISVIGIPIDSAFAVPSFPSILSKLGLDPERRTVLVMGGGAGVLPMDKIIDICDELDVSLQLIVVTGNNNKMYDKVLRRAKDARHPVRVFGFVHNVHELMTVASLLISKPGGMTSAEALAKGLPLLIYRPIPGQEEVNTQYLLTQGVAVQANQLQELKTQLTRLLIDQPAELGVMRRKAFALGRPLAAYDAARIITDKISQFMP
ncbi:Monogalactosyldiacylglycerol synthase [Thermosinus carboxydivorans Nor1]|uniref:Monogalactosyldiacylglycerol synthase n=1 Tax=Thermosinus carboxydivorans Nor1 TaxID=401526 RepID=A1HN53_9FIRM|nr:glycosyltransferase [Thermosinus carboxydivorans]EAX48680.1 Monogalactosyldiacylglycerol synthase [Thermosinus carboxydivorans Nor1]